MASLRSIPNRLAYWKRRAWRFNLTKRKRSTRNLERLCRETASREPTLVVHSEDVDYGPYFPNAFTVTKRPSAPADLHVDAHYHGLATIPEGSYPVILCTGLLEHLPEPQRLVDELHRILTPGGRLIISASAVFSFHEGPDNYFHFTPYGVRELFKGWSRIEMLRGASQPFETIGILLQRINLQAELFPPARILVELLMRVIPLLDCCVVRQYHGRQFRPEHEIDSMMPSNIQAVVVK
jgi:SAM-dependent methyltransferase